MKRLITSILIAAVMLFYCFSCVSCRDKTGDDIGGDADISVSLKQTGDDSQELSLFDRVAGMKNAFDAVIRAIEDNAASGDTDGYKKSDDLFVKKVLVYMLTISADSESSVKKENGGLTAEYGLVSAYAAVCFDTEGELPAAMIGDTVTIPAGSVALNKNYIVITDVVDEGGGICSAYVSYVSADGNSVIDMFIFKLLESEREAASSLQLDYHILSCVAL